MRRGGLNHQDEIGDDNDDDEMIGITHLIRFMMTDDKTFSGCG